MHGSPGFTVLSQLTRQIAGVCDNHWRPNSLNFGDRRYGTRRNLVVTTNYYGAFFSSTSCRLVSLFNENYEFTTEQELVDAAA